jgi:hypothetical protein
MPCGALSGEERVVGNFKHDESGFFFPEAIGFYYREKVRYYDPAKRNVSVGYNRFDDERQVAVTVYVYPFRQEQKDIDSLYEVTKKQLVEAHEGAELVSETGSIDGSLGDIDRPWKQATYAYEATHARKLQEVLSHAILIQEECWWVKLRASHPVDQDAQEEIVAIAEYVLDNRGQPQEPCPVETAGSP